MDSIVSFYTVKKVIFEGMRFFMTALKKPLCGILAFVMVFVLIAAAPVSVFAEEVETTFSASEIEKNKKTDDDGFEYIKVEDGSAIQIVGYTGTEETVKVPSRINSLSVISIGANAFEGNSSMKEIDLHSDITVIGEGAFKNCTALEEIKDAEAVAEIGAGAFEGCTALKEFEIPDTVTAIPERCFYGCSSLETIKEHKNLKDVAKDSFTGTAWENAKEDGALNFGRVLYSYKGNLKEIVIPKDVSLIEPAAFIGYEALEVITLGYDVEEIGAYAFQNCVNLKKVNVDDALGVVDAGAFKGCVSLETIDFSNATVAAIGYEAFSGCTSLKEVKLCETLSDIGDYAFADTKIKSLDLMKNVSAFGVSALLNVDTFECFNVVDKNKTYSAVDGILFNKDGDNLINFPASKTGTYEIPANVKTISDKAFYGSNLSDVTVAKDSALEYIGVSTFQNSDIQSIAIPEKVTKINVATFKDAAKLSKITFAEGVTYIGAEAFSGCVALKEIVLPDSLYEIATKAFFNAGLVTVKTGDGVAEINSEAFAGNKSLVTLDLGKNVEKLGENAFKDCVSLKAVELSESMKTFTANAFAGCSGLKKLTVAKGNDNLKVAANCVYTKDGTLIAVAKTNESLSVPKGVKAIANGAFALCSGVSKLTLPATIVKVESGALDNTAWFKNTNDLVLAGSVLYRFKGNASSVKIPANVATIGDGAFEGSKITAIVIPANVKEIGASAFKDCVALKNVAISNSIEEISTSAFNGCKALKNVVIPASVKVIAADAFANCASLSTVDLGSVEKIEQYAFVNCTALKAVELPSTLSAIDAKAFMDCTTLETIEVAEGNAKYKTLDGFLLIANEEPAEDGAVIFETIALCAPGTKGAVKIPETVKNIADRAFYNCDGITEVGFHDSFANIGKEAFFDCDNIKSVELPESARDIGDHSFASCDSLVEFVVYSNLTDYADNTFEGCNYFNYDAVTINVEDNSSSVLIVVVAVLVVVGIVWYLVYQKKQKKLQVEIIEKNKIKEAIMAEEKK